MIQYTKELLTRGSVKKYLLTYGILALFGVCNLRRVGTPVFVRCRSEIGFTACEICKYISFIKNVLRWLPTLFNKIEKYIIQIKYLNHNYSLKQLSKLI